MDATDLRISDLPEANRFEARRDGELVGFVDYRWVGRRRVLLHTEVPPAFEGQGIASALARHVLDLAREQEERISIKCPYLRTFIDRHPEYAPDDFGRIPKRQGG
jgi:predicted GNAT family acetyltransferase